MEGKHHLGAALGSHLFTEQYINEKVMLCSCCIVALSNIARVHPHAIHSAFTHGLCNKCMDLLSTYHPKDLFTLGNIGSCNLFKILPTLTGRSVSDVESLLALPIRLGGLGIADPQAIPDSEIAASEN